MLAFQGLSSVQSQIRLLPSECIHVGWRREGAADHQHQAEMQVCSGTVLQCSIWVVSTLTQMLTQMFFLSLDSREEYCSFFAESGLCPFEEECRYLTAKNTDQRGSFRSVCVYSVA